MASYSPPTGTKRVATTDETPLRVIGIAGQTAPLITLETPEGNIVDTFGPGTVHIDGGNASGA
jgi:hypothetical protein